MSFCHRLWFSNFNIIATQCRTTLIFQTINAVRSNNVSLKYQKCSSSGWYMISSGWYMISSGWYMISSGCKDTRITKIEFVAKTPLGKNRT